MELTYMEVVPVKNKILSNALVAITMFLLAASVAQGQTVMCGSSPCVSGDTSATGILGLNVGGTFYDVTFVLTDAEPLYGPPPGVYDFTTDNEATEAIDAVNAALDSVPTIFFVGETPYEVAAYRVPFDFVEFLMTPNVEALDGFYREEETAWLLFPGGTASGLYTDATMYADFEEVGGSPAPMISFSANPPNIDLGDTSLLLWSVTDADSCDGSLGSGDWPGAKDPVFGEWVVSPMVTSDYILTCDGPGGQSEDNVIVTVPEPGAILSMAAALATLGVVRRWRRKESEGTA
jgi:hypothetical protein